MKKFSLLIFLFTYAYLSAQNLNEKQLDSLYNLFLKVHQMSVHLPDKPESVTEITKCGFGIVNQVKHNIENFSAEKQQLLKSLLDRPSKQTSMVSPAGHFRIHYNTSGIDIPSYNSALTIEENVMKVALALDSTYKFEVTFLGYPPPPPDNGGEDNLYDVYIDNLGSGESGVYGYTETETHLGNQKYTSFMVIDDDYSNYYSGGLDGMMVTVAHEFHHAIQLGNYIYRAEDLFFYEITSTAMEEFVFDSVNDYYAYMSSYFNNTSIAFSNTDGYELAIWNIFLKDKFGYDILKRQWQLLTQTRALYAINTSLTEYNSSFKDALHEFGVWTFFTGYRSQQGKYFKEAVEYPAVKSISSIFFETPEEKIIVNSKPMVNSFVTFINRSSTPDDSLIVLVTNADYINGVSNTNANFPFDYTIFDYAAPGSMRLNENFNYYFLFEVDEPVLWSHSEFLNNELIGEHRFFTNYDHAFPSPFIYDRNTFIFIPVSNPESDNVDLNVYSSSMDLMFSSNESLNIKNGQTGVFWNALSNDNQRLASGVYVYAVKSGEKTSIGKLVIFNE
jgi:hypothetical protein